MPDPLTERERIEQALTAALMEAWQKARSDQPRRPTDTRRDVYFSVKKAVEVLAPVVDALAGRGSAPPEGTPAFQCDYARMWDLVRHQRSELLDAGLITREEYAELLSAETANAPGQGSPSARRLESYDELRAKLAEPTRAPEAALTDDVLHAATEAIFGYSWRRPGLQYEKGRAILVAALKETR